MCMDGGDIVKRWAHTERRLANATDQVKFRSMYIEPIRFECDRGSGSLAWANAQQGAYTAALVVCEKSLANHATMMLQL